jgi:hypothetical protein
MNGPTANESWIIDAGDVVIQKKAAAGVGSLSPIERLLYCVWVADYGMRNAGDLEAARALYADFQPDAARLAQELGLPLTHSAFALATADLEREYFDRFEGICDELRPALSCGGPR